MFPHMEVATTGARHEKKLYCLEGLTPIQLGRRLAPSYVVPSGFGKGRVKCLRPGMQSGLFFAPGLGRLCPLRSGCISQR